MSVESLVANDCGDALAPYRTERSDISEETVRKFYDEIAARGWYPLLLGEREQSHKETTEWVVSHLPEQGTFVDIGCAGGALTNYYAKAIPDARIIGVDLSLEMLKLAKQQALQIGAANADYIQASAVRLPVTAFDAAIATFSLHETSRVSGYFYREPNPDFWSKIGALSKASTILLAFHAYFPEMLGCQLAGIADALHYKYSVQVRESRNCSLLLAALERTGRQ